MAVPYHEQMHTAIWNWIKERTTSREARNPGTPKDILVDLVSKIPHEHPPNHPESIYPDYVSGYNYGSGTIQEIFSFSEQMCTVAEFLYRDGRQSKISWYDMKRILKFYIEDINEYINHINDLNWNFHRLNSYFELNLNDLRFPNSVMVEQLLWARYLTGTRIFHVNYDGPEIFTCELLVRGEDYWGPKVSNYLMPWFPIMYYEEEDEELSDYEEGDEETSKKKEALKKIQAIVDEVSDDIGDGGYLKLMNVMKELWQS